jgi:ribosomal protein L19
VVGDLEDQGIVAAGVTGHISTVDPDDGIAEDTLKLDEKALVRILLAESKFLSVPANVGYLLGVRIAQRAESVGIGIGKTACEGIGVESLLQGHRPIVRKIYLLPVGIFIESVCRADSRVIFFEAKIVKRLKIIFKLKKPIFIKIQFFHSENPFKQIFLQIHYTMHQRQIQYQKHNKIHIFDKQPI